MVLEDFYKSVLYFCIIYQTSMIQCCIVDINTNGSNAFITLQHRNITPLTNTDFSQFFLSDSATKFLGFFKYKLIFIKLNNPIY